MEKAAERSVVRLTVEISCGRSTCWDPVSDTMCSEVVARRFGQEFVCGLFAEVLTESKRRLLKRCKKCLKAEKVLKLRSVEMLRTKI